MALITDGGPAFPVKEGSPLARGMSLRDWFAGQALAISALAALGRTMEGKETPTAQQVAADAYEMADAMLAERMSTND